MRQWPSIDDFLLDVRYCLRTLAKNPGFTAVAVLTLALGIGANASIFSVVHGVLLAPLPYSEPDRLAMVWENNPRFQRVWASYPNFRDWQRSARSFRQLAAGLDHGVDLTSPGVPEHINERQISSGFFGTLGVELALGREFTSQEDQHSGNPVAIISSHVWRNRFGSSPAVLGKTVTLSGKDCTIVGVASPGFKLVQKYADVYTPLGQSDPLILNDRAAHAGIFVIGRLEPRVTLFQSQAEMSTIQNGLDQLYPDANRDLGIYVEPLKQVIVGDVGRMLLFLLGAVGFVLLIACANVANLLLSRSAARAREFAIRSAIGANRARLVRQLLTESVLLSILGAGLGLVIAMLGVRSTVAAVPGILPRIEDTRVNGAVLTLYLGRVNCGRNSVRNRSCTEKLEHRSTGLSEGRRARFWEPTSSGSKRSRDRPDGLNSRIVNRRGTVISNDSSTLGCESRFRHATPRHLQSSGFTIADEDGLKRAYCLPAVNRAHSPSPRHSGSGIYRHCSVKRTRRDHALLD